MAAPVSAALFDKVDDYADLWRRRKLSRWKKRLRRSHPLVVFAESFLEQFASNHLNSKRKIVGLNPRSANRLVAIRRRLEQDEKLPATRLVLFSLEQLCTLVAEATYDAADEASIEFHNDFFPALLRAISRWAANELGDAELTERAAEALEYYEGTVLHDPQDDDE